MRNARFVLLPVLALLAACVSDAPRGNPPPPRYETEYERGYRDAAGAPRPNVYGPIAVSRATYGTWKHSCNATSLIAGRASGRHHFQMRVSNDMCGDPDHGKAKSLDVSYYCGNYAKTASAREHDTLTLSCP